MRRMMFLLMLLGGLASCTSTTTGQNGAEKSDKDSLMKRTDEEWKKILSKEQYAVLREKSTERPYSGEYYLLDEEGTYVCAACGAPLFSSKDKFDAGCGWPSFSDAITEGRIIEKKDYSHGMLRTEILCASCGGHLGHVFDDGPQPTGLRYCVNSASLNFQAQKK